MLGHAKKWDITFQTAEPGDYTVTVKLLVDKEEYCEKVETIRFMRSGQVHTTSYSQQYYDTAEVVPFNFSQANPSYADSTDSNYDNHYYAGYSYDD